MTQRLTTTFLVTAVALAVLAVGAGAAGASSSTSASATAAKAQVVPIAMRDPGCHWFQVGGKYQAKLVVNGKTAFRNLDEAAVVFKGKGFARRLAVGKTLAVATPGLYHITMVGQHKGDNVLTLIVK
jgi:hypothetical protein